MLYFAFGSNLHHKQMKRRCKDSKYIGCYSLKGYKLTFRNYFLGGGVADIQKKKTVMYQEQYTEYPKEMKKNQMYMKIIQKHMLKNILDFMEKK